MDTIGIVIYCQGFLLPRPYGYFVREMGLCDLSGKNRKVFAYENKGPSYNKLSAEAKKAVDDACKQHGVSYEPKYPARSNCLTVDLMSLWLSLHQRTDRTWVFGRGMLWLKRF